MAGRNWSLADVFVTLDHILIEEFADGDAIGIELTDDDTMATNGANGAVAFSFKHNNIAEVTLTILQTSVDNQRIAERVDAILAARRGSIAISVIDGRGTTVFSSSQAVPKKRAPMPMAAEAGSREWVFSAVAETYQLGGNELA